MNAELAIELAIVIPLAGALLLSLCGRNPNLREAVTLITASALFLTVATIYPAVAAGARPEVQLFELMPGLAFAFRVEPLGMLFALVASGLWIVTSIYAIGYMRKNKEQNQTRFFAFFAISLAAAIGIAFAANMFTLFIFYEVLTLSTYPLVSHHGTEKAVRGARTYLGLLLATSIGFLFVALLWTWQLTGTLDFREGGILAGNIDGWAAGALLALYMFGIGKAALMPFHRWLPSAMVAPTPVSALLHAVAVVKAGVFTVLKVVVYLFGTDFLAGAEWSEWLIYAAAFTLLAASLVALTRDNLKARLAYSTVSQLSYIVLAAALANAWSISGGGMHIAMHAFGKITLFFCAGAIYVTLKKTEISDMDGIGRAMPVTLGAFAIGAITVIGLPPTGGAWSKWFLVMGALDAGQQLMVVVLLVSSLLNIAYLMPLVARGFFRPPRAGIPDKLHEAPLLCLVPICITAAGCVALFFFAQPIADLLTPLTAPGATR
jgi:multicomponent Na+:H+ antiporter subunit D